ncbi:hypothetical protein KKD52_13575 [Myxococcota bacterium]|nr:hypothetical protein [Myxococcota bacterium]MBU1410735.1 hypothetical protein [Myxococcota bacterium]MBU1511384.1 hypothetical protein [Myxococcota bacterium]
MKKALLLIASLFLVFACSPGGGDNNGNNTNNTNNVDRCNCTDSDGDTICDFDEGKSAGSDYDVDGTPDYLDLDSDNDGIPDRTEAGDLDKCTAPYDTDFDGNGDFIDMDSDANGIMDIIEGTGDVDGDGVPNFQDTDNDGDFIPDTVEIGDPSQGIPDTDNDGLPDYNDVDSDSDGIGDLFETYRDTDGDGIMNFRDLDSDNDGIPDSWEGGTNGNVTQQPLDSDLDGHYDFLDADSDNDGLPDGQEDTNQNGLLDPGESDPRNADTDNDGVNDLIEMAAGTDPQDATDNPRANGDFVFIEPFEEDPDPWNDVLAFSTAFQKLDLMFLMDVSGSMASEINAVRNNLGTMLNDVICAAGEDPSVDHCIPDVETGIALFGEGSPSYTLTKALDNNNLPGDPGADAQCTYNRLPTDAPGYNEHPVSAMRGVVTGTCASDATRTGRGCFRPGSLHLLLLITDEDLDEDPLYPSFQTAYNDIYNAGARIIVDYGAGTTTDINNLLTGLTGAAVSGNYLVPAIDAAAAAGIPACAGLGSNVFYNSRAAVRGDDANAGAALSCAVQAVGAYVPQDVEAWIINDPANVDPLGNPVDAPTAFIDYIEVFMVDADATCPAGYNVADSDSNGYNDKFVSILPGNPVCWKIFVKSNVTVQPATTPQMFMATVEVHGIGGAMLDSRDVYFLVPPVIEGPGGPDK